MNEISSAVFPDTSPAGSARTAALAAADRFSQTATSMVSYESTGTVLVIGSSTEVLNRLDDLAQRMQVYALITWSGGDTGKVDGVSISYARLVSLTGHLGDYRVAVAVNNTTLDLASAWKLSKPGFDLVLDLGDPGVLDAERNPPGYFAPGNDQGALQTALEELPALVGAFDKPKYFIYNPEICAHGERGITGCTRCLDACATRAIVSAGERIEVDPFLCQGIGSCASVCPTGAIGYAFPNRDDFMERLRTMMHAYRALQETGPVLLFYDAERGEDWLREVGPNLPEHVIALEIEEVGALGLDAMLMCVVYGASGCVVLASKQTPPAAIKHLRADIALTNAILAALGFNNGLLRLVNDQPESEFSKALESGDALPVPATFAALGEKRTVLRMALDHLYAQSDQSCTQIHLETDAYFGEVMVDTNACTLCMSCVTVCPTGALNHGVDTPRLSFSEWNCVQCGICETACPENAISRSQRLLLAPELRKASRVLHEELPFECIGCGKPFATRSVVARMMDKLKDHRMFEGAGINRIQMCEDCRVKDMFNAPS